MGPHRFQVLGGKALLEAALQGSFPDRPVPAIGGVAEVGPSARFSPGGINSDRALAGLNDSNELALWHLGTAGNAATFGDMTAFWQEQPSRDMPIGISVETPMGD